MKLSEGEKLILLMLSEVFEKLKVQGSIDPGLVKNAISSDHLWVLKREYDRIMESRNNHHSEQLTDILAVWTITE